MRAGIDGIISLFEKWVLWRYADPLGSHGNFHGVGTGTRTLEAGAAGLRVASVALHIAVR